MTASSLVLRTRRRSCYQGRGDLHQARASAAGPTAAEEKHLATLAKPRMVSSQVQLCVYSALHMDHLSRGGSLTTAAPRRSSASSHLRSRSGLGTSGGYRPSLLFSGRCLCYMI